MPRIVLIIEYDGSAYVGWQVQPNGIAVQQILGEALFKLTGERCTLHASGRTDSGVHARAQVAHFDTASRIPADKFAFALNTYLPKDIRIKGSLALPGEEAGENEFHSRFSVRKKHYRYARLFLGTHDFAAFKAVGSKAATTVRTIYKSEWHREGEMLYYDVAGSGFLYNMVRIMVGTMLRIGQGYEDASLIENALMNHSRENAGDTAPAHGLTLWRVEYDEFDTEDILKRNAVEPSEK